MEGYLLKWTNYFFGWRRRYFILHDGVLHYCKDRGSSQRGMIHLEISNIVKHPIKPQRFFIDTGCTQVHLKAYTSGEATEWIRALKNVQTDIKRRTMSEIDPKATALTVDNAPQTLIAGKVGEM